MNENIINGLYTKAKKIRTNLLLYTEKYIQKKQKQDKNLNILYNLENQRIYQKQSLEVSFQECYFKRNVQITTQEISNKEKLIISNLFSISFIHISEKSFCTFKSSSILSTGESIPKNNILKDDKQIINIKNFLYKKSKTKTDKTIFFENNLNKFQIDYKNVNKIKNKTINIFNDSLSINCINNNTIGKKYLRNLAKYLGVIPHRKKKKVEFSTIKKNIKKKKSHKENHQTKINC